MRSVNVWQSLLSFLTAFAVVWIALSIPVLPKHWVAAAIAMFSFCVAAYYGQVRRVQKGPPPQTAPWLFLLFGCIAIALAIGMWMSPPQAPTAAMWLGMLTGILLGGILMAIMQKGKSV